MSKKKPPGVSWESFVERQIREAQESGAFDNLSGFGKPLELDEPEDDLWWVKNLLKREQLSILPPSLEIVEQGLQTIAELRQEDEVRCAVAQINEKIRKANFAITWGPPSTVGLLDAEAVVARWRAARSEKNE